MAKLLRKKQIQSYPSEKMQKKFSKKSICSHFKWLSPCSRKNNRCYFRELSKCRWLGYNSKGTKKLYWQYRKNQQIELSIFFWKIKLFAFYLKILAKLLQKLVASTIRKDYFLHFHQQ